MHKRRHAERSQADNMAPTTWCRQHGADDMAPTTWRRRGRQYVGVFSAEAQRLVILGPRLQPHAGQTRVVSIGVELAGTCGLQTRIVSTTVELAGIYSLQTRVVSITVVLAGVCGLQTWNRTEKSSGCCCRYPVLPGRCFPALPCSTPPYPEGASLPCPALPCLALYVLPRPRSPANFF
eukprot:278602-Chlamydomonas_euryale.AAC.3